MSYARSIVLLLCCSASVRAEQLNLQTPATPMAAQEYTLHTLLLIITGLIFVGVLAVMMYAIVRHRKAAGYQARQFHENTTVEILWTLIPFLILVAIAWPATRAVLAQKSVTGEDMTIKITGYQWKWRYDYLDQGFGFMSHLATPRDDPAAVQRPEYLLEVDEPLVVPTGKKVRLLLTANDVIHSWYVPQLGVKQDAIPGYYRDTWFLVDQPGVYRGQCTELCGKDHGFMPIVVEAKSPADYDKWVAERKKAAQANADDPNKTWTLDELKARGQQVYSQNCIPCHQANGRGIPGTFPALDGSPIVTKNKAAHIDIVLNGSKRNTAMPAWGKQLSDTEIAAVITFERNAWSNHTGEFVQPKEIRAARAGASGNS
ncbi:MAG: cytochrome c oxidase subunit II [Paludibacterium sp.]|uniref:cytochrome c oxidase subunit II n=1 Tax=Paludibacterium sp. TaxID=1917523 RepID=UPI0025E4F021|nr:cytochrome c oxidase subunit II [Paludibacterium sp.]MBV8045808.1 cytochrome c oxidase subunit II [Paludibacterium sp.]